MDLITYWRLQEIQDRLFWEEMAKCRAESPRPAPEELLDPTAYRLVASVAGFAVLVLLGLIWSAAR